MEFTFYEKKFYVIAEKLGLKIEEIDKFKTDLLNESILFTTPQTNRANQPITFEIKFDQFREEFVFTILSTKLEVVEFNERLKLKEQYFAEEIKQRILDLNSYQSVSLINEVLGNDSLEWVENYEKGKMTRDGGIDFTAEFCINREGEISFDGFGKFFKVFGQLKHLSKKMAEPEIRDLIGTMSKDDSKIQYGMVISSRGFSPECQIVIDQAVTSKSNKIKNIFCKDISFIVKLMLKHKIGLEKIQMKTSYFIDEDWWDEIKKFT